MEPDPRRRPAIPLGSGHGRQQQARTARHAERRHRGGVPLWFPQRPARPARPVARPARHRGGSHQHPRHRRHRTGGHRRPVGGQWHLGDAPHPAGRRGPHRSLGHHGGRRGNHRRLPDLPVERPSRLPGAARRLCHRPRHRPECAARQRVHPRRPARRTVARLHRVGGGSHLVGGGHGSVAACPLQCRRAALPHLQRGQRPGPRRPAHCTRRVGRDPQPGRRRPVPRHQPCGQHVEYRRHRAEPVEPAPVDTVGPRGQSGRLDRRGDGQHDGSPACLPGCGPGDDRCR